jgi:hypothetical protein
MHCTQLKSCLAHHSNSFLSLDAPPPILKSVVYSVLDLQVRILICMLPRPRPLQLLLEIASFLFCAKTRECRGCGFNDCYLAVCPTSVAHYRYRIPQISSYDTMRPSSIVKICVTQTNSEVRKVTYQIATRCSELTLLQTLLTPPSL